ncbi:alpha/beta hydrolase [Sphingomonas sp. R-74633]|uniref:alpha/beta hydrolase n=1 Tax=Sphingomonas sp. R-74633 TaxID=2751188 RepID=UPI0015D329D6|nr:alpha/beta hydrolase [Sphingomonas sp. R-74633]NYT40356.1 alpha/beta hydrolase [Sphingomonas sp. R-74633]
MWRWAAGAALALVLAGGALAIFVSPPGLLSLADAAMGGGDEVVLAGSAVPFGTHGQTLDIWRDPADSHVPRPVLIFWYGGGWVKGDRRAYAFAARAFAKAGFVVVVPDYRKVPGVRFPAFLQDGAQAVKWTRDHIAEFGGDPGRIALAGHSAGAYTVAMLALDQRWLKAEGVDPAIVRAGVGLSGPYDFYPFTAKRSIDAMQGVADPAMTQPIHFARADAPPLLLVTSGGDTEVRPRNAINLAARLHAAGAAVTLKNYPGLTHEEVVMALSVPFRGKGPTLADSVAFLNAALEPR